MAMTHITRHHSPSLRRKGPTGPDRRTFLRNSWLLGMGGTLGAFGLASIGFLWPRLGSGFGAEINLGPLDALLGDIDAGGGRLEYPAGRLYMVRYDRAADPEGIYGDLTGGARVMALYQKCVHLGCRVPWCASSNWFECPCHGSQYNRWGEYRFGPAPRGLDRFPTELVDGEVQVNTSQIVTGPSRTTNVLGEPPTGAHCT
jgi:cytochrome b6-f complex iron-sulfur subunit